MKQRQAFVVLALVGLLLSPAWAADVNWIGGNSAESWDDSANWTALPASGDNVTFIDGASTSVSAVLQSSATVGNITFNSTAATGGFTLSGTTSDLTLAVGGIVTVANTFPSAVISVQTLANGTANTFDVGSGSILTLSNGFVAASPHTLTKQNAGTLVLSGTNTLQTVNITGGALNISGADGTKVVNGTVTLTGATLLCNNGSVTDFLGAINLDGASSATLRGGTISGTITTVSGSQLIINSGTVTSSLSLGNGSAFTVGGGTFNTPITAAGGTVVTSSGGAAFNDNITLSTGANFNCTAGTPTFSGGTITLNDNSTATLRGLTNSDTIVVGSAAARLTITNGAYTGAWTLSDGTILAINGGTISPTGGITAGGETQINVTSTPQFTVPVVLNDNAIWNHSAGNPTYGGTASFTLNGSSTATLRGSAAGMPGPISASGWSSVTVNNGIWNGDITLSNTSVLFQKISSGPTFNGNVAISDNASAYLYFAGNATPSSQTITVSGNGLATMGSNGKTWGNFVLSNNARLVFSGNEKPGGLSMTDNAILDMVYGVVGTDVTFNGNVSANLNASGTIRGTITGNLTLSDYASFDANDKLKVNGAITLSGTSHISHVAGAAQINYQVYGAGNMTVRDDATITDTSDSGWYFYNAASTLTVQDRANVFLRVGRADSAVVTQGNAVVVLHGFNGPNQTQSVTAGGASNLTMYGGQISGNLFANDGATVTITENVSGDITASGTSQVTIRGSNLSGSPGTATVNNSAALTLYGGTISRTIVANDTSSVTLGGSISGAITVAPGASIAFTNGTITSDINSILDSQVTWGGGTPYALGALTISSTVNVSGSKIFTVLAWADTTGTNPRVNLTALTGSGTITMAGAPDTILALTSNDTSATTWTGDIVVQSGAVRAIDDTLPAGLDSFVLSSAANSKLLLIASNTISGIIPMGARKFIGAGTVIADDTLDGPGIYTLESAGGIWQPANSPGSLTVKGNLALAYNSTASTYARLEIEAVSGTSYDSLLVTSDTTGYGNLTGLDNADLVLDIARSGWASYVGATLTIVTAVNDLSAIAPFNSVTWNNNMVGQVNYTSGAITLTHVGLAGDGNNDGAIDATDYADWFNNYGTTPAAWAAGDFNGDGSVDATDYALWFNNYGAGVSGGPVPEPATMALLVLGSLAMLRRRK